MSWGPFPLKINFPWTENFPKISLLKVENFSTSKFFSDGKFVSANHILQNFLSAENFPEWKWAFKTVNEWGISGTRLPDCNFTSNACEKGAGSSIYIWSRNLVAQSEASFVLTAQTKTIERDWNWRSNSSFNFRHLGKECVEISYFDFDLKNNIVILWTENLISD
jgi:hypothetical protein